jgi:hypothetical protein
VATDGGALIVNVYVRMAVAPVLSVAVTVTVDVPTAVGVPEITPVFGLIDKPAGTPLADHVIVPVPPVADMVGLGYTRPRVDAGNVDGPLIVSAGLIVNVYARVAVALKASVTLTCTVNEPDAVGVPEITPVAAPIERPAGRPLAVQV